MTVRAVGDAWRAMVKPERKEVRHVRLGVTRISTYAEELEALGLNGWAAPLRAALAESERLATEGAAARTRLEAKRQELTTAIAEGTMDPEAAAVEAERAESAAPQAMAMANTAKAAVLRAAVVALHEHADELRAELDGIIGECAEEIRKVAPVAAGIRSNEQAVRASSKERDAWLRLAELRVRVDAAWRLASRLRVDGLLESLSPRVAPSDSPAWRYRSDLDELAHPRDVVGAIMAGGVPGVPSAEEVAHVHLAPKPEPEPRRKGGIAAW